QLPAQAVPARIVGRPRESAPAYRSRASNDPLYADSGRFATAKANAGHAALQSMGFKSREQGDKNAGTRRADWMAQRACAAMNIDLVVRQIEIAHGGHSNDCKSFIDLKEIDITEIPADFLGKLAYRPNGSSGIKVRLVGMGCMADQNRTRRKSALFRLRCAHEDECSRSIRD